MFLIYTKLIPTIRKLLKVQKNLKFFVEYLNTDRIYLVILSWIQRHVVDTNQLRGVFKYDVILGC